MSSEQLKAMLFDLDDTVIAFDAVTDQSWQEVCRQFAPRIKGIEVNRLYTTIKEIKDWDISDKERHRYMRLNIDAYRREMVGMSFARLGIDAPALVNEMAD